MFESRQIRAQTHKKRQLPGSCRSIFDVEIHYSTTTKVALALARLACNWM